LGVLCSGVLGFMRFVASDLFDTGEVTVVGYLVWPVRSTFT
jgi:hypothetical protein